METEICSNRIIRSKFNEIKNIQQKFICNLCGIKFINKNILNIHREYYCHRIEFNKRKSSNYSSILPTKRLCNEFDNQLIDIKRINYVPISESSSLLNINRRLNFQEENIYQCQFCSIRFRLRETLQAHQENYCLAYEKQIYSSSNQLKYYLYNDQSCLNKDIQCKTLLFKCLICLIIFNDEIMLVNHIRCVHINSKLIQCLECRSKFSSKWNLIRHMKILHTNIYLNFKDNEQNLSNLILLSQMRDNYCSFCQILFRQNSSYQVHRLFYCPRKIST